MTDDETRELLARAERLDRQTRRLNVMLAAGALLFIAIATASSALAARNKVTFSDSLGSVSLSSAGLDFKDKAGVSRLSLYTTSDGSPFIRLKDGANRARTFIGMGTDGNPHAEFDDTSATQRLYVGLSSAERGMVRMYTASAKEQTSFEDTFIRIQDQSGVLQAELGVGTSGEPVLNLYDSSATRRVFAGIYSNGDSGLSAYNASGTATWSSP